MGNDDIGTLCAPEARLAAWLVEFNRAMARRNSAEFKDLFEKGGFWKDILAFTWEYRTFSGQDEIASAFARTVRRVGARNFRQAEGRSPPKAVRRMGRTVIEAYLAFDTEVGQGVAFVRLVEDASSKAVPRIWILLTTLHALRGHEEKIGENRPTGNEYSQIVSPLSWRQVREKESRYEDHDPQVLIVGAGQSGLILAARLRQMGVDALIVERQARVGDNWRERYNNLTLHNEVIANHFPYLPFPETWPRWLPKDMLGSWLESYAQFLELNVWTATTVERASYQAGPASWDVLLARGDGSTRSMRCKHLVLATGVSGGAPNRPDMPGLADFRGMVIHSSEFRSGLDWVGRRAIIVGTGNSGHDIAQDLHVSGAKAVSIVQRGPTCVVSLDPSARLTYMIFNEGRPVEDVDLMTAAIPYPVLERTYKSLTKRTKEYDKDLLNRLEGVGFKTYHGADETGFQMLYSRGAGGYYIDVGCCELIIDRKIGLLRAEDINRFCADGLLMSDGRLIPADLVVLATGFCGMEASIETLFGTEVAAKVGPVWGFDEDGVMRNMWRRTAQDGLWLTGGAIIETRLYSRFLALEILASLKGLLPDRQAMPVPRESATDEVVALKH